VTPGDRVEEVGVRVFASKPRALASGHALPGGARIEGVEGLRALAAVSIVVYHVWVASGPSESPVSLGPISRHLLPNLQVGVTLFFTLSGFLLYRRFAERILRCEPRPSFRSYFRNRALRILPAYWVALVLSGFLLQTVLVTTHGGRHVGGLQEDWPLFPLSALFLQNLSPARMLGGIGPAWSLVVEAAFYVALPLLVLVAVRLARRATTRARRRAAALAPAVVLFAIGFSGKAVAFALVSSRRFPSGWSGDWQSVVERGFWGQADLFAFGLVVAVLSVEIADGAITMPSRWRRYAYGGAAVLAVATAAFLPNEDAQRGELGHFVYGPLMALACGLFLAAVVIPTPGRRREGFVRVLEARPLVWLGLVSYSLFLWHLPIIYWMRRHDLTFRGRQGLVVNLLLLGALSIGAATASYLLVERPALARRRRSAFPARA
jgi:peptidoglycan/LPS O-acetylase OafA/YrhL